MRGLKAWMTIGAMVLVLGTQGIMADDHDNEAPDMAAMMEMMAKAAAPGEEHEQLKAFEGVWEAQMQLLGGPEPIEARGIMQSEMVLGGRFLWSRYKGEMLGRQFLGIALDGYDKQSEKHIGVWLDTMGTTIALFKGEASDDGKVRTMYAEVDDPATGETKNVKGVTTLVSAGRYTYEAWEQGGDGEFVKTMQIIFSKQ